MYPGRVYTVQFNAVAATAQQDLFEIVAAAAKPCHVLAISLDNLTEVGDAAEEMLSILVKSGQTTSGSGGTAPTPVPLSFADAAAGFTAEVNNTTKALAGTIVTHYAFGWNVRMPFREVFTPEQWIELVAARRLTVELATTPADSITLSGTITVGELG